MPGGLLYSGVQLVGAGLFFVLPAGLWRPVLLVLINIGTASALLVGARRRGPPAAAAWYVLAAAQVLNAAAWVCWYLYPVLAGVTLPTPSPGDLMFLASYGLSAVGLSLKAHGHGARRDTLIDAAILATAMAVLAWVVFLSGSTDAGLSRPALAVNLGYVAGDVLLLAAAAAYAFSARRSARSALLVSWAVAQLTADVLFNLQVLDGSFRLGNGTFAWWMASMALLSAAALQPTTSAPQTAKPTEHPTAARRWQHPIVIVAVLALPLLLVLRAVQSSTADVFVIAGGSLLVTMLVVIRLTTTEHDSAITGEARAGLRLSVLRLCAGIIVLALLPLAGLVYLAVHEVRSDAETQTRQRLTTSTDVSVTLVGARMQGLQTLVSSYAERPSLVRTLSTGSDINLRLLQDHITSLHLRSAAFVGGWATDASGNLLAMDPPQPNLIGRNFANRDYFQGAMRARGPYVSEAFVGAIPGDPLVIAVSTPIYRGDRIVGLLGIGYRLDALAASIDELANAQRVELKMTDRRGTLLSGPHSRGASLISGADDEHVVDALAGRAGTDRKSIDGVDTLTAYRPVPGLAWAVVAQIPAHEALAAARRFTGRVIAVASLLAQALLIGLMLAVRAERRRRVSDAELAQREEHVTAILQAAGDAFVSTDANGRITRWNTQAETTFGWPATQALGEPLVDLVVPDDERDALLTWVTAVQNGGVTHQVGQHVEVQARRRDGNLFAAELTVCSSTSEKATFSAFIRDITDRNQAHAQIAAVRDDALAASRMKSEFVANMSHEIRTPMNGVIGLTGLLLETNVDARQHDYLTTVQNSAEALLTVINDILDFSKIEAGKLDIDPVDFDVRALAEEVVSLLAATAQAKGLEIAAVVNPAIPPGLRGDVHRIRQILINLLSNAVKFTEHGEVTMTVEIGPAEGSPPIHSVGFSVTDTGIGIPADRQAHLFDAFTQVDSSTTRRYSGTGLGLTISRQLVELMGGTFGLNSRLGEGSRFHFGLSLPSATAAFPTQQQPADLAGVRVLVVDDNATNRMVVGDLLTTWGMRPTMVEGAEEALTALHVAARAGEAFPVALLDMHMPDIDGLGLARMITADVVIGTTRLAMLTSTNAEAPVARDYGIQAYLAKPIRAAKLYTTLRHLLGHPLPAGLDEQPVDDTPTAGPTSGARILIAEDNEVNQLVAVEILASLGYTADIAADGQQAVRLLQSRHYDAVLMDCQMPVLDGFQATMKIRRMPAPLNAVPIIALTASALASDEQRCRAVGMDNFLSKPINKQDLADILRGVLSRRAESSDAAASPTPPPTSFDDPLEPTLLKELREMGGAITSRVLPVYLHDAPIAAAAIAAAAARQDMTELARLAHKLRGSSGALAGHHLAATCAAMEQAVNDGDISTATSLVSTVEEQTDATCRALRVALATDVSVGSHDETAHARALLGD